jgi:hypothetical protein
LQYLIVTTQPPAHLFAFIISAKHPTTADLFAVLGKIVLKNVLKVD